MGNRIANTPAPDGLPPCGAGAEAGFTLIELVVVMSLLALMLYVAIPRLQNDLLTDGTLKASRWIMTQVRTLQEKSVREQRTFTLNLDLGEGRMWVTHPAMDEVQQAAAEDGAYRLPQDVTLRDVAFPGGIRQAIGIARIRFYPEEYADMAMIHLADTDGREFSFRIEPFLPGVKLFEETVELE